MTTTYSVHPPAAATSRRLLPHHHHSHSPHQQYRRNQASSFDSTRATATFISPSSIQRIVNSIDGTTVTATIPATIGITAPPLPFDTIAAPNPAVAALNGAICRPSSSDCGGSSSGLGGMTKTDLISSDESSLASEISDSIDPGDNVEWFQYLQIDQTQDVEKLKNIGRTSTIVEL
uniref:Uncharacterized protein n=1 Tax=Setaria digitata TaxID=48799 RepID=A0A915PIM0_9BILA